MAVIQTTSINVAEVLEQGRGPQMELDGYQGYLAYVKHFPAQWDKITNSIGSISFGSGGVKSNIYEWLSFSASTEVSTQYPITGIISWGIYGAVENLAGDSIGTQAIKLDAAHSRFVASQPCYADIEVEYNSHYAMLKYLPQITGNTMKYGVIRSRFNNQVAQFRVPPPSLGNNEVELCRVVSYYVIGELDGERGSYEMPDNFPNNTGYPVTSKTIEPEGSLKVERAHEIVTVTQSSATWSKGYYNQVLIPYIANTNYKPKYFFKKNSAPGDQWKTVFEKVKWEAIKQQLEDTYEGLQEG